MKNQTISVKDSEIKVISKHNEDYISITDIARHKNPDEPKDIVKNWMRSKTMIKFFSLWEKLHNPNFKGVEFDSFMYQAGTTIKSRYIPEISGFTVHPELRFLSKGCKYW